MHIYIYVYTHDVNVGSCQPPAPEAEGGTALGLLLMHAVADAQTEMPGALENCNFQQGKRRI